MNDYQVRRLQHSPPQFSSVPGYYYADRSAPLALSHASRTDPRGCPVGSRNRMGSGREDMSIEGNGTQARRRIAVACARCRKRKIRCSGDPGNGTGCQNCKAAGADVSACQFHRVGSGDVTQVMNQRDLRDTYSTFPDPMGLHGMHLSDGMLPLCSASNPLFSRSFSSASYPQINTRSNYPQTWTSLPYNEDASPVEPHSLSATAYTPSNEPLQTMYGDGVRWDVKSGVANGNAQYWNSNFASYPANATRYISTTVGQPSVATEVFSPLNMTSLQSTLPMAMPTHERPMGERQLPIPLPTRSRSSMNVVDKLQTRSLPSSQNTNTSTNGMSVDTNGTYTKAVMAWSTEAAGAGTHPNTSASSSIELSAPKSSEVYASTPDHSEAVLGYNFSATPGLIPAVSKPASPDSSTANITTPLNFSTSSLSESLSVVPTTRYSNFRDYGIPSSSSTEALALLSRQDSQTNLYSFSADNSSRRDSLNEVSRSSTLASGNTYVPLCAPGPQRRANIESLRRDSFDNYRTNFTHRASVPTPNSSF